MSEIRLAIVGVGNCAASLVQGISRYSELDKLDGAVPGVMHNDMGGYTLGDIKVVAAFDVDESKIGRDVAEAIFTDNNNVVKFHQPPPTATKVERGPVMDGIGEYLRDVVEVAGDNDKKVADVAGILKERKVDVVVNYLPVGSQKATEWYAEQALAAGCAFVNCIPVFLASDANWERKFAERGLPLVGDDIKSQVGATIVHRMLVKLFEQRGVRLDRTYQLNVGGNTDFQNMLERRRLTSKKISKTQSVQSQLETDLPDDDIHIGPSDWVPWLKDRKWAYIRLEGTTWGDVPLNAELKLEVEDSPNSAGVAVDAIRCAKIAKDRGIAGAVEAPSAYFMKSPPKQFFDSEAHQMVEDFIAGS